MQTVPDLPDRERFVGWVHDALTHLYDTQHLNKHPLADLLLGPLPNAPQRSQPLRRLLVDAIRALRPAPGTPAQSPDWRNHHILELRYIEGLTPAETMGRLALSKSHYYREQARVIEAVADLLWTQAAARQQAAPQPSLPRTLPPDSSRSALAQAEVERLCAQATWEPTNVAGLFSDLQPVIESLAAANGVHLQMAAAAPLHIAQGNRTLLRQSILNVVSYALDMAPGGALSIEPIRANGESGFVFRARRSGPETVTERRRQGVGLEIGRQLVEAMRGRLTWEETPDTWEARLAWQTVPNQTLLVIDDNRSFIDLVRRYLSGTSWQVSGASSGEEARKFLADQQVAAIVLDIMMPEEDGWELLRALRGGETTRHTPIIVCSVLNEPQLARMLGANAYLPKPVSPLALLQALPDASQATAHPESQPASAPPPPTPAHRRGESPPHPRDAG